MQGFVQIQTEGENFMFVVRRAEPVPCSVTVPYFFYSQLTDPRLYDQQVSYEYEYVVGV